MGIAMEQFDTTTDRSHIEIIRSLRVRLADVLFTLKSVERALGSTEVHRQYVLETIERAEVALNQIEGVV
jgi:hypothetical protein